MAKFDHWCDEVVRLVRFKPDRPAIATELRHHYEDSVQDYLRIGFEEKLAEDRALRDLGDAEEVGRAMDRAHKLWLGRLWQASRVVLLLAALFAASYMNEYALEGMPGRIRLAPEPYFKNVEVMEDLPCPADFQSGIYTYTFQHVEYLWDGWGNVTVCMNAFTPRFWMEGPDFTALTAADSLGRTYLSNGRHYVFGASSSDRVNSACVIQISTGEQWPEWVEVTHKTAGWSFRIHLPREGGSL